VNDDHRGHCRREKVFDLEKSCVRRAFCYPRGMKAKISTLWRCEIALRFCFPGNQIRDADSRKSPLDDRNKLPPALRMFLLIDLEPNTRLTSIFDCRANDEQYVKKTPHERKQAIAFALTVR
jgi:hypothetical protein